MGKVKIDYKVLGMVSTNCYFVCNGETMETVIIDPADNYNAIVDRIAEKGYIPKAVFLTHGHFDHILAAREICDKYGIKCYSHEAEADLAMDSSMNLSTSFMGPFTLKVDETFVDGQEIDMAGMHFKVLHTPGHTKGSCCYYLKEEGILISGDTIFNESVGRTDFPTGNAATLLCSIRDKIFVLPEDTKIYPGHGSETTLEYEKVHNCCVSYLNGDYEF
ncbi:MAG: MBL fold metallo-hydrolase [Thermoflexaceae bacterium]|nr:MBL fold metallo-hydrolase [Thermoflexaceae bacterium]